MTASTLIEPPASDHAPGRASHLPAPREPLGELPPLLGFVPVAGPPAFVLVGFGAVLLLLLVPPLTLLATVVALALVVATALVVVVALVVAILDAPFRVVRFVRGHRPHFSPSIPELRKVKVRRA